MNKKFFSTTDQNKFEERALVDLEELDVPAGDVVGALLPRIVVLGRRRVVAVVRAPRNHLHQFNQFTFIDGFPVPS